MSNHLAASLATTVLLLGLFAQASCGHPTPPPTPTQPMAWTLSAEADEYDRFCVDIPALPNYPWTHVGLHCALVKDLRLLMGHLKYADH